MTGEQLVFGVPEAEAAAREGMERASLAARSQSWKEEATSWLLCQPRGLEITADDLVAAVGLPDEGPERNNVVGAWVNAQARRGHLRFTGSYRKSERVSRHRNAQRVWEVA